jgi:hypothetical protein
METPITCYPVCTDSGSQPLRPSDRPGKPGPQRTGTNIRRAEPPSQSKKPRQRWHDTSLALGAVLYIVIEGLIVSIPPSSLRTRLTWGATLAGVGGTIGGALGLVVDIGSLGLSGGLGTLMGAAAGASVGAALALRIEGSPVLLERGDAFDFLYDRRKRYPKVSTPQLVEKALNLISSYDKNDDGRRWYAKADLERFLEEVPPAPPSSLVPPSLADS